MTARSFTWLLLAAQLTAAAAFAEERTAAPAAADPPDATSVPSMRRFGETDKLCLEWSDGCSGCRRVGAEEPTCSNIGIACQPTEITCVRRQDETTK